MVPEMVSLAESRPSGRVPSAHLEGNTPAVLRFLDGQHIGANRLQSLGFLFWT